MKMIGKKTGLGVMALVSIVVTAPLPAHAYLDPGSGSMIFQGIIAGLAMISVTLKMYWHKVRSLFRGSGRHTARDDEER